MCAECGNPYLPFDEHCLYLNFWRHDLIWRRTARLSFSIPDGYTYNQVYSMKLRRIRTCLNNLYKKGLLERRYCEQGYFRYYEYKISGIGSVDFVLTMKRKMRQSGV